MARKASSERRASHSLASDQKPIADFTRSRGERYVGRFAPSPSGPLHFGSLVAAVGSYLQALASGGRWLVRMEDIDTPRTRPGADVDILRTLDNFGFEWDGTVEYQSRRLALYQDALSRLESTGLIYKCSCSRSDLMNQEESRYPGTCSHGPIHPDRALASRFRSPERDVAFKDLVQGSYVQNVAATCGDFVIRRRDGLFAYHLAVVVDDGLQSVTEIVRGADLLESTPRQILLQEALGFTTPVYAHLPLAVDRHGDKLSKSAQSIRVDPARSTEVLWAVLDFLRQSPPLALKSGSNRELWNWAREHWNLGAFQQVKSDRAPQPLEGRESS